MAPKKNTEKPPTLEKKSKEKKVSKQKLKKEKPKLKIPTIIRIKIPNTNTTINKNDKSLVLKNVQTKKESSAKLTKKQKAATTKLEKANEVARLQLVKTEPTQINEVNTSTVPILVETPTAPVRKRGRQTRNIKTEPTDTTTAPGLTDSEDAFDMTPKKRKYVRKMPEPEAAKPIAPQPQILQPKASQPKVPQPKATQPKVPQPKATQSKVSQPKATQPKVSQPKATQPNVSQPKVPVKKKTILIRKGKVTEKKCETKKNLKPRNITKLKITLAKTAKQNSETTNDTKATSLETSPSKRKLTLRRQKPDAGNIPTGMSFSDTLKSPLALDQLENIVPQNETSSNLETTCKPTKNNDQASPINSRKSSLTAASELSWTKDISSSSTTTCAPVCSTDFVRIDKKLPVLSLANIDHLSKLYNLPKELDLSSDSDSSSSISLTPKTPDHEPSRSPSLDIRSRSYAPSEVSNDDRCSALDRLTASMKNFDLEIMNWIGYDNTDINIDIKQFQDKTFTILKEESEVIAHCQRLKRVFSDIEEDTSYIFNSDRPRAEANVKDVNDFAVPLVSSGIKPVSDGQHNASINNVNKNYENQSQPKAFHDDFEDDENDFASDKHKDVSFDQNYDDDDTLSLFAESITGMESCRNNSSVASVENTVRDNFHLEEYIPQPLSQDRLREPVTKITYVPTKISNSCQDKKIVCEKQRADSTSITKDVQEGNNVMDTIESIQVASTSNGEMNDSSHGAVEKKKTPCLMGTLGNKSLHGVRSMVFRGVCFYNLISSCKVAMCRYPHIIFEPTQITMRLVRLSEEAFIQEYMLLRNWPVLRRAYGMCFVEECKRRELTRILVEMAIDFYMKAKKEFREDLHLKVIVAECVLLYLNVVDLNTCEDLLLYNLQPGVLLCDELMKTIAVTQNFSRFKPVFINLTKFIVENGRSFNVEVATQILERVCILPCELPLSTALLDIVKNTDPQIFEVSMMRIFEKQLSNLDKELYEQFLVLKKEASVNRPVLSNLFETLRLNPQVEPVINTSLVHNEIEARYTSPDTTNLDSMNKPTEETRTPSETFTRHKPFNIQLSITNSPSKAVEDSPPSRPTPNFQTWRGQSVFDKIRALSPQNQTSYRPPLIKRRIHQQTAGHNPALTTEIKRR